MACLDRRVDSGLNCVNHKRELLPPARNLCRLFGCLLVLATFASYLPALRGQFVWDDDSWTLNIAALLRDFSGLRFIWFQPTALQQYYPLTATTFWFDYQFWGFWTTPYHIENVLLHSVAALLFWRLLRRLQAPGAWLAGAIFALHPLMVESAAWITERKNVLSLALYLAALLAYGQFTGFWQINTVPNPASDALTTRRRGAYVLAWFLFLGALLAKATAFSLPAVLLLICWWKRGRIRWRTDVLPTLPFFAATLGLGLVTSWLEKSHVGAEGPEWAFTFPARCLIAGRALWFYAGKLFWPARLCFLYPRWQLDPGSFRQWLFPVTAAGALLALWLARRRIGRGPAAAAFFFAGTLFPVLGFMNAYFMRYSFVCDHWAYLSSLGLIALGAGLVARAAECLRRRALVCGFAAVVLPLLAALTWEQSRMYSDIEILWLTTLDRNPNASMAHINLGALLLEQGRVDEALAHCEQARQISPGDPDAWYNLGLARFANGQVDTAATCFAKTLEIQPGYAKAHFSLGTLLFQKGQPEEALSHFQKALENRPDYAEAHNNLAAILLEKGRVGEAISHFQKALEIQPDNAQAQFNLGNLLLQSGRVDEAIAHLRRAVELRPDFTEGREILDRLLRSRGTPDETPGNGPQNPAPAPDRP